MNDLSPVQDGASRRPGEPPAVTAVVPTVDRPESLLRAVRSILHQDYPGWIEVVVVHDGTPPRAPDVGVLPPRRGLRVMANTRTPGLAGARNTGILAAGGDLVAFCDDDDLWRSSKLDRQVEAWQATRDASAVATGMTLALPEGASDLIPPARTRHRDLVRSRVLGLHPSSLLIPRSLLRGEVGLVDEDLPGSYGEDYDLLLRLTRHGDIVVVQGPLLVVEWSGSSYFDGRWTLIAQALAHLLDKHPDIARDRRGWSRVAGQIAFAQAAAARTGTGGRQRSLRWSVRALGRDPRQLRAWAALAVAAGLVDPAWLLARVQRRGHGL